MEAKKQLLRLKLDIETKKLDLGLNLGNQSLNFIKRIVAITEHISIYQVYGFLKSSVDPDVHANLHDHLFFKVCNQILMELVTTKKENQIPQLMDENCTNHLGKSLQTSE